MVAQSSEQMSAADAERIRRRYPRSRLPRGVWVALIAVVAAVSGGWLIWAATIRSHPDVSGVISAYAVRSDTRLDATLTIDRADPSRAAACRVMAQATDYQPVGEQTVTVPAAAQNVVDVEVSLTTLRRATTAVVRECSLT